MISVSVVLAWAAARWAAAQAQSWQARLSVRPPVLRDPQHRFMASRPYMSVRVHFDNSDYDNVCLDYGGGQARLAAWRDLGDLLAHRVGWHFDVNTASADPVLWNAGLFGESRLNIHVAGNGGYACFDYDADKAGDPNPVTVCA